MPNSKLRVISQADINQTPTTYWSAVVSGISGLASLSPATAFSPSQGGHFLVMASFELQKLEMLSVWRCEWECPQELKGFNTWSPGGGTVWINLGGVASLEKTHPWGAGFQGFCFWFGLGFLWVTVLLSSIPRVSFPLPACSSKCESPASRTCHQAFASSRRTPNPWSHKPK